MGDIDDFFAKKDKKKKGGKKFAKANTDVVAKNLIETDKKEMREMEKAEKELSTQYSEERSTAIPQNSQEDEEWEEYRENKKDFSGLKIENLNVQEAQPEAEEEETEINEDGEVVKVKKDDSGPWNKANATAAPTTNHEPQQQDLYVKPDTSIQNTNVVAGSYVPPHLRGSAAAAAAAQPVAPRSRRGNKAAPDISSELNFPSLSMAAEDSKVKVGGRDEGGKFEEVKSQGGIKNISTRAPNAPSITLDNRYSCLGD